MEVASGPRDPIEICAEFVIVSERTDRAAGADAITSHTIGQFGPDAIYGRANAF